MRQLNHLFASAFLLLIAACGNPDLERQHQFHIESSNQVDGSFVSATIDEAFIELIDAKGNVSARFDASKQLAARNGKSISFRLGDHAGLKIGESYDIVSEIHGRAKSRPNFNINGMQNAHAKIASREKVGSVKFDQSKQHSFTLAISLNESIGRDLQVTAMFQIVKRETRS